MNPTPAVDVVVVQKQTALERYTRRALNVDFLDYVERGGGSLEHLREAHDEHVETRERVKADLTARGLTSVIWNLDELSAAGLEFWLPREGGVDDASGGGRNRRLRPRTGLVVSLGGDGTFLHASHYVGGDVSILGVNSCPAHSVGALCAAGRDTFASHLDEVLSGSAPLVRTRRLWVRTSENHQLPLALNDLLLCNQHPAATSRYLISVVHGQADEDGSVPFRSESQLSSGLWVAAPAGSSAVIGGYGMARLSLGSSRFQLAVREPYLEVGASPYQIDRLSLDGDQQTLSLFSRMRAGLVCVDGPDNGVVLGFGARVMVSLPAEAVLSLVPPRKSACSGRALPGGAGG